MRTFKVKHAHVLNRMNARFKLNVRTFKIDLVILEKTVFLLYELHKKQFFYLDL